MLCYKYINTFWINIYINIYMNSDLLQFNTKIEISTLFNQLRF